MTASLHPTRVLLGEHPGSGPALLQRLIELSVLLEEDFARLDEARRTEVRRLASAADLLETLTAQGLLTEFQARRIRTCLPEEIGDRLVLGNYRILDTIGAGGMGMVFRAEHVLMRRQVAIKVLRAECEGDPRLLSRFLAEVRAIAGLRHPNIVGAFDAGKVHDPERADLVSYYLVMEHVEGEDLEARVQKRGPLSVGEACELIYQLAGALVEVHEQGLVHRDLKPSNVLVTPAGEATLLDFGLARHFGRQHLTEHGAILGTFGFMAPEQWEDASQVDIRADIYGLGGVLYWCLSGRAPFPTEGPGMAGLLRRLTEAPPPLRQHRADVPTGLEAVAACMLAARPADRYPTPDAVLRALLPYLPGASAPAHRAAPLSPSNQAALVERFTAGPTRSERALIADDDPIHRSICAAALQQEGLACTTVDHGEAALRAAADGAFDLVLLDIDMPRLPGPEVLRQLRERPPCPNLKVLMLSGHVSGDDMARMLAAGADDYLVKPVSLVQLAARARSLLQLKKAQDRASLLTSQLYAINGELERAALAQSGDTLQVRNTLMLALARLVEQKTSGTSARLLRIQRYCRCLAEAARGEPGLDSSLDEDFVHMLESCAPLYDIGKVVLPDELLRKPGPLAEDERLLVQSHTVVGAEAFRGQARDSGQALAFLQMAADLARHHHERYDGQGYPDGLAGTDIPLGARLLALADVYDALRSPRPHRPALPHHAAVLLMTERSEGQFDPVLLRALRTVAPVFQKIFRDVPNTLDGA